MTAEPYQTFRDQGYYVFEGALDDQELAGLRAAADVLLAEDPDDGGGNTHNIGRGEARRFLRHRHEEFPAVNSFLFSDKMRARVTGLIGEKAYLFNEQFVVKGADTGASFAWHQDGGYVGFNHKPYLTVWVALDDATLENGCVYILPRNLDEDDSVIEHRWDEAGKEKVGYDGDDPGVAMTCKAGTIVAFSSTTLHCSGGNTTQNRRRAYVCQYSPEPIIDPATGELKRFAKELA